MSRLHHERRASERVWEKEADRERGREMKRQGSHSCTAYVGEELSLRRQFRNEAYVVYVAGQLVGRSAEVTE